MTEIRIRLEDDGSVVVGDMDKIKEWCNEHKKTFKVGLLDEGGHNKQLTYVGWRRDDGDG